MATELHGSVLSLTLFNNYMKPLDDATGQHGLGYY